MAKLQIQVDPDLCATCDICAQTAPNTFEIDNDGKAVVKDPAGDSEETIIEAAEGCPTAAISVKHGDTGEQLVPKD